jgi:REP element-mobilizing transposase RayT
MPRRRRGQGTCRLHHITTRGNNQRLMFADDEDRERFYDLLDTGIATHQVECHQDVQMGNHVHLLLEGKTEDVSQVLWFVSHRYALAFNRRHGRINHLLGRRFYASEVPDRYAARAVCIYIAMNPVRAGLCSHPLGWEFGSYRAHTVGDRPRPHLATEYTRSLFASRASTFEASVDAAIAIHRGGRPALSAILPALEDLTPEHVRHARDVYGFTLPQIAAHYGRSQRYVAAQAGSRATIGPLLAPAPLRPR